MDLIPLGASLSPYTASEVPVWKAASQQRRLAECGEHEKRTHLMCAGHTICLCQGLLLMQTCQGSGALIG